MGYALVTAALAKARELGLLRVEAACLAENLPAMSLLQKAGFRPEGLAVGMIRKGGRPRDVRTFALML